MNKMKLGSGLKKTGSSGMKATVKAKDLPTYKLAPWAMKYNVDRDKGIPVETQFSGTRMFVVQDHILILNDSVGEELSVRLENIPELIIELQGIYDAFY